MKRKTGCPTYINKSGIIGPSLLVLAGILIVLGVPSGRPSAADAQNAVVSPTPAPAAPRPWLEHWRLSTFSFGRVSKDQKDRDFFEVIGTGITVSTSPSVGYIVTAKHVFYDPPKNWHPNEVRVRWAWQEQKSVYEELGSALKLRDPDGRDLWVSAAGDSDVAAIPTVPLNVGGTHSQESISIKDFANPDDLYEGGTVVVLGYPGIVGNEYLVRAIVRSGIVAWRDPSRLFREAIPH